MVFKITFYHWKYFFGTVVGLKAAKTKQDVTHHQELITLIQILVQSFQEANSDMIKQTLSYINQLNERFFLYSKPFFRQVLFVPFLEFFMDLNLSGLHDAIKEELLEQMVKMILVDTPSFQQQFLSYYINKKQSTRPFLEPLAPYLSRINDAQTCLEYLNAFINDVRYYSTCV